MALLFMEPYIFTVPSFWYDLNTDEKGLKQQIITIIIFLVVINIRNVKLFFLFWYVFPLYFSDC